MPHRQNATTMTRRVGIPARYAEVSALPIANTYLPVDVRFRNASTATETAAQTQQRHGQPADLGDRQVLHQLGGPGLRREAAGVGDHEPAQHRVDAEREDHRRHAQVGHPHPVDEPDQQPDAESGRDRGGPADGRGHHRRGRDRPRHRQVDVTEQDHEHHAGGDDPEERADLQLLEQVRRRQQRRGALGAHRVRGADREDHDDEAAGEQDRAVLLLQAHQRNSSSVFLHPQHPHRPEADRGEQHDALEQRFAAAGRSRRCGS